MKKMSPPILSLPFCLFFFFLMDRRGLEEKSILLKHPVFIQTSQGKRNAISIVALKQRWALPCLRSWLSGSEEINKLWF